MRTPGKSWVLSGASTDCCAERRFGRIELPPSRGLCVAAVHRSQGVPSGKRRPACEVGVKLSLGMEQVKGRSTEASMSLRQCRERPIDNTAKIYAVNKGSDEPASARKAATMVVRSAGHGPCDKKSAVSPKRGAADLPTPSRRAAKGPWAAGLRREGPLQRLEARLNRARQVPMAASASEIKFTKSWRGK